MMKKAWKRVLSLLLTLMMLLSLLPVSAMAADDTVVAKIGEKEYTSLQTAFNEAKDNDVIDLQCDISGYTTLNTGKKVILDLGTHTVTGRIAVNGGDLTVRNGHIENTGDGGVAVFGSSTDVENYSVFTLESTADVSGTWSVIVSGAGAYGAYYGYGGVVNIKGSLTGPLWVMGNLGNDEKSAAAIEESDNKMTINLESGAEITNTLGPAVALNGYAKLNVKEGLR